MHEERACGREATARRVTGAQACSSAVLVLAGGGYSLVQSLVVPALPTLQLRLHTTPTGVAWVFTAFLLSAAVATPLAGRLGDLYRPSADPALARSPLSLPESSSPH